MKLKYMAIMAVSVSLLLAGCGSDSDSPTGTPAGTSTPTVTGVVSFSSASVIAVNNVSYDVTSTTSFTKEGLPATLSMINPGMVVTIEGPHANGVGVAHKVKYDSEVEGFVVTAEISLVVDSDPMTYTGTMDVMGQAITIDESTHFSGIDDPTLIVANNVVEVSGMFQDDGSILAKYVEYKAAELMPGDEIEIKGYVAAYDPTGGNDQLGSFMLGTCTINVTADTKNEIDVLEDGMKVEVEATAEDILKTEPCEVNAAEIENKDHKGYRGMDYVEGMVVGDLLDGEFMLQQGDKEPVAVMIDDNTHYVNGTQENIVAGAKLKAVGLVDDNGVLTAKLIKFEDMEMKFDKARG
ncbi:MAG: DUF5666 domain-containing protein, partial [Thiohalomonadales bacterium]